MINITVNGKCQQFEKGTTVNDVFEAMLDLKTSKRPLGAFFKAYSIELMAKLYEDATLVPIDYDTEEGRRIYERSLSLLVLAAIKNLYPAKHTEVEDAVGKSLAFKLLDKTLSHSDVSDIEAEMHRLVHLALPIEKYVWTTEEAMKFFEQDDQADKVRLLKYRKSPTFTIYRLNDTYDYFYGSMLPNTSYLTSFSLSSRYPGMMVNYPKDSSMNIVADHSSHKKQYRVFAESQKWCEILQATNVADVNKMIKTGKILEFIRINEALHDSSIADIARDILNKKSRIVLIFGPSCSGKTTFTHRLDVHLRVHGLNPALVSLDDFYKDRHLLIPDKNGEIDLETIHSIDVDLIVDCFDRLLMGEAVGMPRFDFVSGIRKNDAYTMQLMPDQPILVEGIHAMNDLITSKLPEQLIYGIYVSAISCLKLDNHNRIHTSDARLLRRIVRDMQFRGTSPEQTINMWKSVRDGEEKWIYPNQEKADIMFNTALHYELPLLHSFIYDSLEKIDLGSKNYIPARRIVKSLNYFLPIGEEVMREIPPLSILREFIGGCSFYTGRD